MELNITEDLEKMLPKIRKELGKLKAEAPKVLKNAINKAATQTKKVLLNTAKEKYDIKKPTEGDYGDNTPIAAASTFKTARATTQKLVAQLITKSKTKNEAIRFNVTPRRVASQKGVAPPKFYSLRVLKGGGLKPLNKYSNKPFLVKFKSGHLSLARRVITQKLRQGKRKSLIKEKDKIEVLYSPANASIYGSKEMLQQAQDVWQPILKNAIEEAIKKTLVNAQHKSTASTK